MMGEDSLSQRELWLDGLRGIAALAVAFYHYASDEIPTLYRSFWRYPPEENRHLYQLLPIRAFVAGPAMVRLFFVISGYSLTIGLPSPPSSCDTDAGKELFYRKLSSAVFRRGIRLFIPVAIWSGICHILFFVGAHPGFPGSSYCPEGTSFPSSPLPLVSCYIGYLIDLGNFLDTDKIWNLGFNNTLWSIPFEIRGSLAIYIQMLGTANLRPKVRLAIITIFTIIWWWSGTVEMPGFAAGLLLAEMRKIISARHFHDGSTKSCFILKITDVDTQRPPRGFSIASVQTLASSLALLVGIYFISLPGTENGTITADYELFYSSPRWESVRFAYSYHHIGAALVLASLLGLRVVRRLLETTIPQFLGTISFAFFLVHHTVYNISKQSVLSWISWLLGIGNETIGDSMPHTMIAARILTGLTEGALSLLLAVKMTPLLDQWPRLWAISIEKKLLAY